MQENNKPDKDAMDAFREYLSRQIALSLYVTDKEKEALQEMGYNPEGLLCIDRLPHESVFIQIKASLICLDRAHGGGGSVHPRSRYEKRALAFLED